MGAGVQAQDCLRYKFVPQTSTCVSAGKGLGSSAFSRQGAIASIPQAAIAAEEESRGSSPSAKVKSQCRIGT